MSEMRFAIQLHLNYCMYFKWIFDRYQFLQPAEILIEIYGAAAQENAFSEIIKCAPTREMMTPPTTTTRRTSICVPISNVDVTFKVFVWGEGGHIMGSCRRDHCIQHASFLYIVVEPKASPPRIRIFCT